MSPINTGSVLDYCAEGTDGAWSTENEYNVDVAGITGGIGKGGRLVGNHWKWVRNIHE